MAEVDRAYAAAVIRRAMDHLEALGQTRYLMSKDFHDKYKPARLAVLQRELDALERDDAEQPELSQTATKSTRLQRRRAATEVSHG